jgi:VWFA-related protein
MHPFQSVVKHALAGLLISAVAAAAQQQQVQQSTAAQPVEKNSAGAPTPASNAAPITSSNGPASSTILQASANLVLVDVVVTDRGKAVHGLSPQQFHVFENGHEQKITSFDEHQQDAAPTVAAMAVALPPHVYSNIPAYPQASAVNVLLLDGLNTPMANQLETRRQMLQFMGKIAPGTSLAIFTLSSRLRLVEGFTTDVSRLTAALKSGKAGPQQSVILDPESDADVDSVIGDMANMGGGSDSSVSLAYGTNAIQAMQQFQADLTAYQTDQRVLMTLDAMQQLARYLSGIPGRKNLIWFSGSFPIILAPDDSLSSPFEAMRSYTEQIRETAELLSAARVAVYPVDARGLMTLKSADASYSPTTNLMGATVNGGRGGTRQMASANKPNPGNDNMKFLQQTMAEQASMQQIAQQTGGVEYINTNGLKEAVASAIENGSSYYTIGYVPEAKDLNGEFRKLQVRTDHAEYKLAYRDGYYADPLTKASTHHPGAASLIMAATLHGAPPSSQILFRARVLESTDPLLKDAKLPPELLGEMAKTLKAPTHRFVADLNVDPRGLEYDVSPDNAHMAKIEFAMVAYGADGKRLNYLDFGYQLNIKADQFAQVMRNGVPVRMAIDLPAGPAYLRIAVHDLDAGRAGSLEVPVMESLK